MRLTKINFTMRDKAELYAELKKLHASGDLSYKTFTQDEKEFFRKKFETQEVSITDTALTFYKPKNKYLNAPAKKITKAKNIITITKDNPQGTESTVETYKLEGGK